MPCPPLPAAQRLVWPLEDWPEIDRRLWQAGLEPGDGFDGPNYAAGLAETTLINARKGYGRLLAVLAAAGELDPTEMPAARVTRARAKLYLRVLLAENSNNTIHARLWELQAALRVMQPEHNFGWLTVWMHRLLPVRTREMAVLDSRVLVAWGEALMQEGLAHPRAPVRRTLYRNGLLIGILALFAPRLRSVASLRLGCQVVRDPGGAWKLMLRPEDVKNRRPLPYEVPAELGLCIDRYLAVERMELLEEQRHDWFWVGQGGARLNARGIDGMIRRASAERFGEPFGTHTFRRSLATTAAHAHPSNPGLAPAVLGVTEAVVDKHYNRAWQVDALAQFQVCLAAEREQIGGGLEGK